VTCMAPRVCIIIQNLWVPFDRRVWNECLALKEAGYQVTVVCPKGPKDGRHQVLDGIPVYQYKAFPPITTKIAFIGEYLYSFLMTAWLVAKVRRKHGIDVLQACNPPDIFWPIAKWLTARHGTRFVFDQHDLCPEVYLSRFPEASKVPHRGLLALERATYRAAHHVISTNESYRMKALTRGGKHGAEVTVVRTGPNPARFNRIEADPALRYGRDHLLVYIGVMGPQDGVDHAIRALDVLVHEMGRTDVHATFIGRGDDFDRLRSLSSQLNLDDHCDFPGRIDDEEVRAIMSTAVLGLSPDPKNPLNDVSTMNKTMEYMAYELPVVAYDLIETKVSAQDAALYATANDVRDYAKCIATLLDDPETRREMSVLGRRRVEDVLAWHHQAERYVSVFDRLTGWRFPAGSPSSAPNADRSHEASASNPNIAQNAS
jgi:glycosyltransferase involved in cell wall biosynthesis